MENSAVPPSANIPASISSPLELIASTHLAPSQWHIASLVAHVRPQQLDEIKHWLLQQPLVEIHGESAQGKLVILAESASEKTIADLLDQLRQQQGVLNAALVYHEILSAEDLLDDLPEPPLHENAKE